MPETDYKIFSDAASMAARLSGRFIMENLGGLKEKDIDVKQASDFVTRIDRESEKIIIDAIREDFPSHKFLTEESLKENDAGGYRWIIDPLDGTTNYIHSYPAFSVSIALEHKGEIIIGVVYDPVKEELFSGMKNEGAFLNGEKLGVSQTDGMKNALVATGFPFRNKDKIDLYLDAFKRIFVKIGDFRRDGSAAIDLAYVAAGRFDGFFEIGLSPWDVAAGALLIKEAGGVMTDFGGGRDYLKTGNVVAGNPDMHEGLLKIVKGVFREA